MTPFQYERAHDTISALALGADPAAKYLGGGTNLVDLMRETIERPETLVDVSDLSKTIEEFDGGLRIGAGTRNSALAADRRVREFYPMLSQAVLAGASPQIRNMATVGGNIMQRTRGMYFYDEAAHCNKRVPGAGCDAMHGFNRGHAILGVSTECIATHPSDMCVALAALDATVSIEGFDGRREIPLANFHCLPEQSPHIETLLGPGEIITSITLPKRTSKSCSIYRKVRDRASYAFALVSLAADLTIEDGHISRARLALGGVAHRPWRAHSAEAMLTGAPPSESLFRSAASTELSAARSLEHNNFKIELAQRLIVDTLMKLSEA